MQNSRLRACPGIAATLFEVVGERAGAVSRYMMLSMFQICDTVAIATIMLVIVEPHFSSFPAACRRRDPSHAAVSLRLMRSVLILAAVRGLQEQLTGMLGYPTRSRFNSPFGQHV